MGKRLDELEMRGIPGIVVGKRLEELEMTRILG